MRKTIRLIVTFSLILFQSLWSVPSAFAQDQAPQVHITQVDNSKFPNVTVYVSVTDAAGNPVGIDPSTIQIMENGQAMEPTDIRGGGSAVGGEAIPVTTLLVIDISGSMEKNDKIGAAKNAAKTYVSQMRPGDQAGLIAFDTEVHNIQTPTSDIPSLTNAIDGLKTGSDTAMYNALIEAEKSLDSVSGRKAIIVLTDGLDNRSQNKADDVIKGIGQGGLTISAIGFGDVGATGQFGLDETGLKSLTQNAGGQYAFVSDAQTLSALYQQYGQSLQSEYAITYVSPLTLRDGVNRDLTVTLSGSPTTVTGQYNPGGVLPEVPTRSWSLFGLILLGLIALLVIPVAIGRGMQGFGGFSFGKKSRVKMAGAVGAAGGGSGGKRPRIKIK
jgi:Ca-activated chloride channel homolog